MGVENVISSFEKVANGGNFNRVRVKYNYKGIFNIQITKLRTGLNKQQWPKFRFFKVDKFSKFGRLTFLGQGLRRHF